MPRLIWGPEGSKPRYADDPVLSVLPDGMTYGEAVAIIAQVACSAWETPVAEGTLQWIANAMWPVFGPALYRAIDIPWEEGLHPVETPGVLGPDLVIATVLMRPSIALELKALGTHMNRNLLGQALAVYADLSQWWHLEPSNFKLVVLTADTRSNAILDIPSDALRLNWWDLPFSEAPELDALSKVLRAQALNTGADWDEAEAALGLLPIRNDHMEWAAARLLHNAVRRKQSRVRLVVSLRTKLTDLLAVDESTVTVTPRKRRPESRTHLPYLEVFLPSGRGVLIGAGVNTHAVEFATDWQPTAEPVALTRGRLDATPGALRRTTPSAFPPRPPGTSGAWRNWSPARISGGLS